MLGSGAVIVIDDRACMVQLGLRVAQFYMHESCGKCTPCREGTRWMVQILQEARGGARRAGRARPPAGRLRPDPRQLPLPARRRGRDADRELRRQVPRGVPAPHRRGRLPVRRASRPSRASSRRSTSTTPTCAADRGSGMSVAASARSGGRPRALLIRARPPGRHAASTLVGTEAADERARAVTVTVDGREVQVPKGTGMIETALAAGIEIPVFCYEPRLGPPVGACRMCLCEVEGMPKLQAACTLHRAGRARRSARRRRARRRPRASSAVLEFILLNHPLDCPDCDKGGECPLQDLTFRFGPGDDADALSQAHVRQADPDLADDLARPRALHPLLPLHALLRGRLRGHASSWRPTAARSRSSRRSRTSRTARTSRAT